ncbi:ribosome small subunit-dependent GTPase A [Bacillus sp. SCS-153A]|uniref:ribosome small subunit-dependent GTPase A n=1 Tax=Rossellomorea sedimentorum TaxID=3115294 RepID=UPI003905DA0E
MNQLQIIFQEKINQLKDTTLTVGRVMSQQKGVYTLISLKGEFQAKLTGRFYYHAQTTEELPAVGDWVAFKSFDHEQAMIEKVLPRSSKFSRKKAGDEAEEQIIAANIDYLFIVSSLNGDLNLNRLERYLLLCWESGASPVIILSKMDLCENLQERISEVEAIAMGVPVLPVSSLEHSGLDQLHSYLSNGKTVALVGSSGVGKSTLLNSLIGESLQAVQEIREKDSKGQHTTTYREMFLLDNGAFIIDTPGMRELQMWEGDEGISMQFKDIEEYAEHCRFRDCQHEEEPHCGIKNAIHQGFLSEERYRSYQKLLKEIEYSKRRADKRLQSLERKKWKKIGKNRVNRS